MTNQNTHKDRQLDNELAEFTDQLLANKTQINLHEIDAQDQTLFELQQTVAHVAEVFGNETMDEAAAQRIESSLMSEWRNVMDAKPKQSLWQRVSNKLPPQKHSRNFKPAYTLAFAALAFLVFAVFVSILTDTLESQNLTGTAFGEGFPYQAFFIFALLILIGFGIYLLIRKRR